MKRPVYQQRPCKHANQALSSIQCLGELDASLTTRDHQYHIPDKGFMSQFIFGLVHMHFPLSKAMNMPETRSSVGPRNGTTSTILPAWDFKKVKPKADLVQEARKTNVQVHLASLMDLPHLKHAALGQLPSDVQRTSRVSGGYVKDDCGFQTVFGEQTSSATQISCGYNIQIYRNGR